jgi:propionate CoA-transferase
MLPKLADTSILNQIKDNDTVAISGFNMATTPEYLIYELYKKYEDQVHPKNLFIISDTLPAVPGRALDKVAEKLFKESKQEFIRGALMPFLGFSPWFQKLVIEDKRVL